MATITFNCPKCGSICGFRDAYAGRRARCLKCGQLFIIPGSDNDKVKKIKPTAEYYGDPLPGFYEAVFKKSLPAIFNRRSLTTLLFIFLVTALKFFTIHLDYSIQIIGRGCTYTVHIPVGWAVAVFVFGGLFYVYAEIVYATAFDIEFLPAIYFEGGFGYIAKVFKSLFSFFMALFASFLPAMIAASIFKNFGIESNFAVYPFVLLGLFLLPNALLTVSMCREILAMFRYDQLFEPVIKAFWHYMLVVAIFIIVWLFGRKANCYNDVADSGDMVILLNLVFALAVQVLIVLAMRVTGLFYRHFSCYYKW